MISEKYINDLLKKYAKTPEGKKAVVNYFLNENREHISSAAADMAKILLRYVQKEIDSITMEDIYIGLPKVNRKYEIEMMVGFREDNLQRNSLWQERYPDGIENIVLLFSRGYKTKGRVQGRWEHPKTGEVIREWTYSKTSREPSTFLQDAVLEFNTANKYGATAVLTEKYSRKN